MIVPHIVGADDFAQLFATKERYRCSLPLAGTHWPEGPLYEEGAVAAGDWGRF